MLYSVVIADLIFKLQRLHDIYKDSTSKRILDQIEQMQTENPTSPAWENTLRDELVKNRRIISTPEAVHIDNLQKDRHLCAHPIIKNGAQLHMPNRASVYSHIITSLAEILTVPAFLEKELLSQILTDLASNGRVLRVASDIEAYLSSKYLDKISSSEIEVKLFIGLWKIVLKLSDKDCDRNRFRNFVFLRFLFKRNEHEVLQRMKTIPEQMSRNIDVNDPVKLGYFVKICNLFPEAYDILEKSFKISFLASIERLTLLKNVCFFLHPDFKEYFENEYLQIVAGDDDIKYAMAYVTKKLGKEAAMRIPIVIFSKSETFEDASNNYNHLIKPRIDGMSINNLQELLDAIAYNSQNKGSFVVQGEYGIIKTSILKKNSNFDFSPYQFLS